METYPQLKLSGQAFNALEGLRLINNLKPDVIFLNPTMPFMKSHQILDHFNTRNHYVILTSALKTSTLTDRRVNDYFLVTVSKSRFADAMHRLDGAYREVLWKLMAGLQLRAKETIALSKRS